MLTTILLCIYFLINGLLTAATIADEFSNRTTFKEFWNNQNWWSKLLLVALPFMALPFFICLAVYLYVETIVSEYNLKALWLWHFNRKKLLIENEDKVDELKNRYYNLRHKSKSQKLTRKEKITLSLAKKIIMYNEATLDSNDYEQRH